MINLQLHAEQLWQGLAMHRFHVHVEEVKRVLSPVLEEVYRFGYQRGVADSSNNIFVTDPEPLEERAVPEWSAPTGAIEAQVELIHHEPEPAICPFPPEDTLETENVQ